MEKIKKITKRKGKHPAIYIAPESSYDVVDSIKHHINLSSFFSLPADQIEIDGRKFNQKRQAKTADDFQIIFDRKFLKTRSDPADKKYFIPGLVEEIDNLVDLYNREKKPGTHDTHLKKSVVLFKKWLDDLNENLNHCEDSTGKENKISSEIQSLKDILVSEKNYDLIIKQMRHWGITDTTDKFILSQRKKHVLHAFMLATRQRHFVSPTINNDKLSKVFCKHLKTAYTKITTTGKRYEEKYREIISYLNNIPSQ